jgi:phosphate transport system permease protein
MIRAFDTARLKKRYAREKRFKFFGAAALAFTACFVFFLLFDIIKTGLPALSEHSVRLTLTLDEASMKENDYFGMARTALRAEFPQLTSKAERKKLDILLSNGAGDDLQGENLPQGTRVTRSILLSSDADLYFKGHIAGKLNADQMAWLETLKTQGKIEQSFNYRFFKNGDSREPELAGIRSALTGSLLTLFVTLLLSLPLGVAAAVYLEEFSPKNRFSEILEVNINNLAAVPSIVFGLLGLAIFLGLFGLPRSAPLVGGLVLALMVLPTIIIASRSALKAVSPSIKEAALGIGASHQQAVFHHVVPLALPGIMTGTIIGIARALGETAPLLMIGMVAFIIDIPQSLKDPATVLPVQVFLWSDLPELGFKARTAAAIMVLLGLLFSLNAVAIFLRNKFERRW